MKDFILNSLSTIDSLFGQLYLTLFKEKKSLITILIHGLFNNAKETKFNSVDPQQSITTEIFRQFIEYFLKHKYIFTTPEDICKGLELDKNYVLITFDDGYYNNHLALPILKEYQVPSTFFISTNHIIENKCFWWDVVYRERRKRNTSIKKINREYDFVKIMKNDTIEKYLMDNFGKNSLDPICDIDRPFTPSELYSFSKEPLTSIGNHTSNHAILTNYSNTEIKSELAECQKSIYELTGITPLIVSYPNGNYSGEVLLISKEIGFRLGIGLHPAKNILPINLQSLNALLLNRHILTGDSNIKYQCAGFRSDIQLKPLLLSLYKHL